MKKGNQEMGMKKHGQSGHNPKSPKLRHAMKREAEKNERKSKQYNMVGSFKELFGDK